MHEDRLPADCLTSLDTLLLPIGMSNKNTPWGEAQSSDVIAEGIVFYSTAGHGGIELSPARQAVVDKKFPNFTPFCGKRCWYEEDCDVAVVAVCFPEHFSANMVETAKKMVNRDLPYFKLNAPIA